MNYARIRELEYIIAQLNEIFRTIAEMDLDEIRSDPQLVREIAEAVLDKRIPLSQIKGTIIGDV
jgi:hypothetical protein